MAKIILSKEFIKQFKAKIGSVGENIEIELDADFLIYLNKEQTFAACKFAKNKNGSFADDDTLVIKDLLIDQIIYADFIQKRIQPDGSEINFIEKRFSKNIKKYGAEK